MPATNTYPACTIQRRRNVTTSWLDSKTVTYVKISPKMVNPRDIAGERRRRRFHLSRGHCTHWSHTPSNPCSRGILFSSFDHGATRDVTVSTPAFLACHQRYCAGSSLAWGLNFRALVCGIFGSSSPGVFSECFCFLPSFIGLMVQLIKQS